MWIPAFAGILLLMSCIVLGKGLIEKCSQLNGAYSMQKVVVSVKNQADSQGRDSFSMDDIYRLEKELSTNDMDYTAKSGLASTAVSYAGASFGVRLTGTGYEFPLYNGLVMEKGSFISKSQEDEGEMVAVIDDELAWTVFKSSDVVGKTLDIFGSHFRIVGVAKKDGSVISKLIDDGLPDVYIPAAVMLELDTTSRVEILQIRTSEGGTLGQNISDVSSALQQTGKNSSSYNMSDLNLKLALMEEEPLLAVFIIGMISILILLSFAKNAALNIYHLLRNGCRTDYFSNVIRNNLKGVGANLLEIAASAAGMALVWLGIAFRLYIPPEYIPDELINTAYYSNLLKSLIQGGIKNMGHVAPVPELTANTAAVLVNILFIVSVILGLLLLYMGLRELRLNVKKSGTVIVFFLYLAISLGVLAATAAWAGLPYILDVKCILVSWAFIYLCILYNTDSLHAGVSPYILSKQKERKVD